MVRKVTKRKRDWSTASAFEKQIEKHFRRRELRASKGEKALVSVKAELYFQAQTEQEKCRASVIMSPTGAELCPKHKMRIACERFYVSNLPAILYYGSMDFEKAVYLLISHSPQFAEVYANVGSRLEAIRIQIEGEIPAGEPPEDYESMQLLADEQFNQSIKFPYIENQDIFKKADMPMEEQNSCLATLIIKTFKTTFARHKMKLDYATLWSICCPNRKQPPPELGYQLQLHEAERFFRLYRLKLVVVDVFMKGVHYYDPRDSGVNLNTHMEPSILRLLKHHNHVYRINKNVNSFDQKVKHMFDNSSQTMPAFKHFFLKTEFDYQEDQVINDFDEVVEYVRSYKGESTRVRIITDLYIEEMIILLKEKYSVVATDLYIRNNVVVGFQLENNGVTFTVCQMRVPENEPNQEATSKQQYDIVMSYYEKIYKHLLTKNHQSYYHPQVLNMLRTYQRGPLTGRFTKDEQYCNGPAPYIDMVKAYTARLLELKYFPVFDPFCVFKKYVAETALEDYAIYLVHKEANSDEEFLIFDRTHVLVSGITLKETKLDCDILYYCSPCKLVPNTISPKVKELWNEDLPISEKKFIMNICLG